MASTDSYAVTVWITDQFSIQIMAMCPLVEGVLIEVVICIADRNQLFRCSVGVGTGQTIWMLVAYYLNVTDIQRAVIQIVTIRYSSHLEYKWSKHVRFSYGGPKIWEKALFVV